ncbi:MAG: hypothetical protein QOK40_1485, partial [Miltoncostaeaceae bacterium]|nr:hypothetical protein [Miltoncostaeaceae bacterium]
MPAAGATQRFDLTPVAVVVNPRA